MNYVSEEQILKAVTQKKHDIGSKAQYGHL